MTYIDKQLKEINELQVKILSTDWREKIERAIKLTTMALKSNKKILFAGNGGSAADAQHMAGEFVSRFEFNRPGLAGLALTVDTSIITACANDYGYDDIFSRQIQALGAGGDVLWAYTTSGKSKNIIKAVHEAKSMNMKTIVFCGENFTEFNNKADEIISIPSTRTPRIQEWHLISGHIICGSVESEIFG